jgi:hypothetical protein
MQSRDCQDRDVYPVLTQTKLSGWSLESRHEKSLLGTQARREGESPTQEAHVAEIHYGKPVIGEPEGPVIHDPPDVERFWGHA